MQRVTFLIAGGAARARRAALASNWDIVVSKGAKEPWSHEAKGAFSRSQDFSLPQEALLQFLAAPWPDNFSFRFVSVCGFSFS